MYRDVLYEYMCRYSPSDICFSNIKIPKLCYYCDKKDDTHLNIKRLFAAGPKNNTEGGNDRTEPMKKRGSRQETKLAE